MTAPPNIAAQTELTIARYAQGDATLRVLGNGAIAIEVGGSGTVIVKTIAAWHALAAPVPGTKVVGREPTPFATTIDEQVRAVEWATEMCVLRNLCGPFIALEGAIATLRAAAPAAPLPAGETDALVAEIDAWLVKPNMAVKPTVQELERLLNAPDAMWRIAINPDGSIDAVPSDAANLLQRARDALAEQANAIKYLQLFETPTDVHNEREILRGKVAALEQANAALAHDAARYRYLRETEAYDTDVLCVVNKASLANAGLDWLTHAQLDAAIDAAMKAGEGAR